jgi:gliding motility-associated-like protein
MRTYILAPTFRDTVITIIAGSNLNYQFTANDAGGDNLSITFNSEVLTRTVNPAKITINGNSPGLINATLNWQTQCSDFGSDTIVIDVNVQDDACPLPNEVNGTIKIVLISEPIGPPYPDCIGVLDDNTLKLKWINGTPNSDFLNYQLYRKINEGPMELYDSIASQLSTNYLDSKTPNILTTNYCYQILSLNSCRIPGDSSRVICSLDKGDSSTSVYFNGLEDEIIILHAFDTFSNSFIISDTDNKDSVFSKVTGSMVELNKASIIPTNGLGSATTLLNWIPNCDDITGDTLELLITVRDNTCPYFKQGNKLIKFLIIPALPAIAPTSYCPKKITTDSILVEWPELEALPLTKEIRLFRKVNEEVELLSTFSDLKTISYTDVYSRNPSDLVCYALSTSDYCDFSGDTSKFSCLQNNSTPAPNLAIYTATVVDDKEIKLIWESANADSFWRYTVEKRVGRFGNNYEKIAEIRNFNDTQIIDNKVKVDDESYCYRIVNMDLCGNLSVNNKEACSILLQGNSIPFENHFNWLPYDYWQDGTNRYEIIKTEPEIYQDLQFATTWNKPLVKIDNQLNYDNGLYQYTILAYENVFGKNQTSQSNTIDLIQLPLLYAPNAYTQNGDGLNDQFHTVPVFVKDYYLQIYNRWGERIFETHDKKQGFSSLYKGKEIKSDVYFYIVEYTGWDGNAYTKKGNFTLLK